MARLGIGNTEMASRAQGNPFRAAAGASGQAAFSGAAPAEDDGPSWGGNFLRALPMLLTGPGGFAATWVGLNMRDQQQEQAATRGGALMQLFQQTQAAGGDFNKAYTTLSGDQQSAILSDPNFLEDFERIKQMAAGPEAIQLGANERLVAPGTFEELVPAQPDQPASIQEMMALGLDPKIPADVEQYTAFKRSQSYGPQAPEPPADVRTLQFIASQQGLDLQKPEDMLKAIDMMGRIQQSTVNQFSYPTGYAPTGETDEMGRPVVSPLSGTPDAEEQESAAVTRQKAAEALDTVIEAIQLNPGEFGTMAGIKEGARAATSAVEQLGQAVGGIVPGATIASEVAGALRRGPLGEPKRGLTRDQTQAILDRLAVDVARSGLSEEGEQRAAQQEINNVREALASGDADIPTVVRRLNVVKELLFGRGVPAADTAGVRAEDIAPGGATSPTAPKASGNAPALPKPIEKMTTKDADAYVNKLSNEQLKALPPDVLDRLISLYEKR